jgi:hypothetical protein
VHGAIVFVIGQGAVRLRALAFRNFQLVAETHGCETKVFVVAFDAALNLGLKIICCRDSTRFQRAGKCAGQSTGERRNDVIDGSGKRCSVFHAVIFCVATMRPKMKGLRESFDVRVPERLLLLNQTNFGRMNKLTHRYLSSR